METRIRVLFFCIAGACLLFLPVLLGDAAAQVRKLTLDELVSKSEIIFTGSVVDKHSEWNAGKTRIYTRVTVEVAEYFKGEGLDNTITVTHLGGEVGDVGELYTGAARFEKDEEVILFVKRDSRGNMRVTGSNQGKYRISSGNRLGKKMITGGRTVDAFIAQIKDIVEQQRLK